MGYKIAPNSEAKSIVQRSMSSGVFGSDKYVGNEAGFVNCVGRHWFKQTEAALTMGHIDAAKDLFAFYEKYRASCRAGLRGSKSVFALYKTGRVSTAMETLGEEVAISSSM